MKIIFLISLISFSSIADTTPKKGQFFDEVQVSIIKNLNEIHNIMNSYKSCVNSATDKKSIISCQKKYKDQSEQIQTIFMDSRKKVMSAYEKIQKQKNNKNNIK